MCPLVLSKAIKMSLVSLTGQNMFYGILKIPSLISFKIYDINIVFGQ